MKWLTYLLEANVYLSIFYGFYRLVLQKETFYRLNRWYLLTSVIVAFTLPLLQIKQRPALSTERIGYAKDFGLSNQTPLTVSAINSQSHTLKIVHTQHSFTFLNWQEVLVFLYVLVVIFSLANISVGIYKIVKLFRCSAKYKNDGVTHVLIDREQEAFSFFSWLFYHPGISSSKAIIEHEMVHIRQKHSIDVLFIELIQALCWFNPLVWFIRADIKLNHEYIADEQASAKDLSRHEYALLLIDHACNGNTPRLSNAMFSPEQLKNRISKLGSRKSGNIAGLKYLLVLPLAALLLGISAFTVKKDYGLITIHMAANLNVNTVGNPQHIVSKIGSLRVADKKEIATGIISDTLKKKIKSHAAPAVEKRINQNDVSLVDSRHVLQKDTTNSENVVNQSDQRIYGHATPSHAGAFNINILKNMLIISNGKETSFTELKTQETNVKDVHIFVDVPESEKYGDKGKNGVAFVTMK